MIVRMTVSALLHLSLSLELYTALASPAPDLATGYRKEKNSDVINKLGRKIEEDPNTAFGIYLPQFLPLAIKYHFAESWCAKGKQDGNASFCNKEETKIIKKCGIDLLYNAIDGRLNHKTPVATGEDFNKALNKLCMLYDKFKRCIQGFYLNDCIQDDKTMVDVLYGYTCGQGKQDITSSYTGYCLSKLTMSSVRTTLQGKARCHNTFSDLSDSLQVFFAKLHDDSWSISDELPAMKEGLSILCRGWYVEEMCVIPVYAKECGETARRFYVRLLNYMKSALAAKYMHYGADMGQLALCERHIGKSLQNKRLKPHPANAFRSYIIKQYNTWAKDDDISEMRLGKCDIRSVYSRMLMCFWRSVFEAGDEVVNLIANFKHHYKDISRLWVGFSHCYDDYVDSCPPENKVSFVRLFQSLNNITLFPENGVNCFDTLHISGSKCGVTLSDIIMYYFYHGAKLYDVKTYTCASYPSLVHMEDLTCMTGETDVIGSDMCDSNVTTAVKAVINNMSKIISDFMDFFGKFPEQWCV